MEKSKAPEHLKIQTISECVDPNIIISHSEHEMEPFLCAICHQIMVFPCYVSCGSTPKHYYGYNCINTWLFKKDINSKCPICKVTCDQMMIDEHYSEEIMKIIAKCSYCEKILPAKNIGEHKLSCEKYRIQKEANFKSIVEKQLQILQKQISPHVKTSHQVIFEKYVLEWQWLYSDMRNWKWWWWANLPWWKDHGPCQPCNDLWHKYQLEIDALEEKRVEYLKERKDAEEYIMWKASSEK